jgi:Stage II sporulation protein M
VQTSDLVLVRGIQATRSTLEAWNRRPLQVLGPWVAGAAAVAAVLLLAVWIVASLHEPDLSRRYQFSGLTRPVTPEDIGLILLGNFLVLALHAMACVAGFIAGSSLPLEAQRYSGFWRRIHDKAGAVALAFVAGATLFSLSSQAVILGTRASNLSAQLNITPAELLVALLPHALPELTALFLPLAAWLIASRRGDWDQLLAATFTTVAIAIPVLVACAFVEVYVSPYLIQAMVG